MVIFENPISWLDPFYIKLLAAFQQRCSPIFKMLKFLLSRNSILKNGTSSHIFGYLELYSMSVYLFKANRYAGLYVGVSYRLCLSSRDETKKKIFSTVNIEKKNEIQNLTGVKALSSRPSGSLLYTCGTIKPYSYAKRFRILYFVL